MLGFLYACASAEGPPAPQDSGAREASAPLHFRWPLTDPAAFYQTTGIDHDPVIHSPGIESALCTNFDGRAFPWCYDEHRGSDYLMEGGFDRMDAGSEPILAAADGVVVEIADGNYDRCHAANAGVECDGYEMLANYVIVEHTGGWQSKYWHMKTASVAVAVGQEVSCGDTLGRVGSSGNSSFPHLHFQVESAAGDVIDPYAGVNTQPESWWTAQGGPEDFPGMECE